MTTPPLVSVFPNLEAASRAAARQLVGDCRKRRGVRDEVHLALSGGSTPRRLLELLATEHRDAIDWSRLHFWWCDERTVPPDHADSNFGTASRLLLAPLDIAPDCIHRIRGEHPDPSAAAAEYDRSLVSVFRGPPRLDLAVLGLGADGHTASLFPGSPATLLGIAQLAPPPGVEESPAPRWVRAQHVTSPLLSGGAASRITLTLATLLLARRLLVLVAGADKAPALREVLAGAFDPMRYPAQLLAACPRPVLWLVDEAAASHLPAGWRASLPS